MGGITTNLPNDFHMNNGQLVGLALRIHLGSANFDATLPETSDVSAVFDVYRYAREPGHTSRNATFDSKMAAIWGSDYSNLDAAYKDACFLNIRAFPFTPPPP